MPPLSRQAVPDACWRGRADRGVQRAFAGYRLSPLVPVHGMISAGMPDLVFPRDVSCREAAGADQDAVTAGLTLPWSSGSVEGHVNRIKMLKRQMYGRANPDPLRRRILLAD